MDPSSHITSLHFTDFDLVGPALYIKKYKTLVLGDLHIGSDEALSASGAFSPVIGINEIQEITNKLLLKLKPEKIILLGDLEVHFGIIPYKQKVAILNYLRELKSKCKDIILIEGNHDKTITKIVGDINLSFVKYYELGNFFFSHGNQVIETSKKYKYVVIGHEHPAITITNNIRTEKFKCVLISNTGKLSKTNKSTEKTLIVLPSLNQTAAGTDILQETLLSPYITKKVLNDSDVFVVEELDIYPFGRLNAIKKQL
jgi:putative SbcD/Mre11-related phosphoesterase